MNFRKRIERLEQFGREIREQEESLAEAARTIGISLKDYKQLQYEIRLLPVEELMKLAGICESSGDLVKSEQSRDDHSW